MRNVDSAHSAVITEAGGVLMFGQQQAAPNDGEEEDDQLVPTSVAALTGARSIGVESVATGPRHTVARQSDGELLVFGQLGADASATGSDCLSVSMPAAARAASRMAPNWQRQAAASALQAYWRQRASKVKRP